MELPVTFEWLRGVFPPGLKAYDPEAQDGFTMAVTAMGPHVVATSLDFANVDTGLVSGSVDVRSEIFTVASATELTAMRAVHAACAVLRASEGKLPAQPGTLVPNIAAAAGLPEDITVKHGLLVSPFVWGGEVPQFSEDDRLTVMLQLIMLTESEFNYLTTYGVADFQEQVASQGIDINDWARPDES